MSKIGFGLSLIGGILFFALTYFFARSYYSMWSLGGSFVYGFLFYLFVNGGAIIGALIGFINKSWNINKNWQIESVKVGRILCFLAGISFPMLWSYFYGNPYYFLYSFFEGFIDAFYITIPMLILFIGSITNIIEWRLGLRKNNFAQK